MFAVLCHLLLWWHKTSLGWLNHPEGGGFNKGGGCIPPKSRHKTSRAGFKGGFVPHFGGGFMPGTRAWGHFAMPIKNPLYMDMGTLCRSTSTGIMRANNHVKRMVTQEAKTAQNCSAGQGLTAEHPPPPPAGNSAICLQLSSQEWGPPFCQLHNLLD